jgi:hypothetical protein
VVSWPGVPPSAGITQRSQARASHHENASSVPSGERSGCSPISEVSHADAPPVAGVTRRPATRPVSVRRMYERTMLVPSGDQDGNPSCAASNVSRRSGCLS